MQANYDFNDLLIRQLVQLNHLPIEEVTRTSGTTVITVLCRQCHCPWPCEAITGLRAWEAAQQ